METRHKLLLIILTFFILSSALSLMARPTGDGAWHFGIIRFIAENHKLPHFENLGRFFFAQPPLYHLFSAIFYSLFSIISTNFAEGVVKVLPPLFGSLCLYFNFLIVKKLFNKDVAIYATFFLAFLPLYFFVSFRTMPTILGVLLTTMAVYFALEKRIFLSGFFAGLSLLAKEQSFFIIFPILFIIFFTDTNRKKVLFKNVFLFLIITTIVASPHYINTFVKLGDPIWPHGYFLFNSPYKQEGESLATLGRTPLNPSNLLNPDYSIVQPYLGFFGVPYSTKSTNVLFFFDIPFLELLLIAWFIATIVFLIPLIYGFWKTNKHHFRFKIILVWFGSFLVLMYFYLFVTGNTTPGYLLSGIPSLAALLGVGFYYIAKKFKKIEKIIFLLYLLIVFGFVSSALIKIVYTNNAYQFYQDDYDWIKANVPEIAVVYFNDQSLTYNTHRFSRFFSNISELKQGFILVNQNYMLNSGLAVLPESIVMEIKNSPKFILVYSNNVTNSTIYRISE